MVVSAVNGVNVNKTYRNNISFGHKDGEAETAPQQGPKRASNFVKVPVIVMMTLSPSLLNSAGAAAQDYQDDMNYPQTELLAMATPEPQSYRSSSASHQSSYVRPQIVQYQERFTSNGVKYTMYYTNPNKARDPKNNYVRDVYFVPDGFSPKLTGTSEEQPPRLSKIRLHQIPSQDSFVGAIVEERKTDGNWYKKEIKLPDNIANGLMDLVEEKTNLRVVEGSPLDKAFWGVNMEQTTSPALLKEQYLK